MTPPDQGYPTHPAAPDIPSRARAIRIARLSRSGGTASQAILANHFYPEVQRCPVPFDFAHFWELLGVKAVVLATLGGGRSEFGDDREGSFRRNCHGILYASRADDAVCFVY